MVTGRDNIKERAFERYRLYHGLYSRVARKLGVDRSYVSRVARGERRSDEIEQALSSEFARVVDENERQTAS